MPTADSYHAMVDEDTGDLFYPDSPDDVERVHTAHGAVPVFDADIRAALGEHRLCDRFPCGAADCDLLEGP